jgi:cytosine/adenosine deaminase-related metal-dependent hydrolase
MHADAEKPDVVILGATVVHPELEGPAVVAPDTAVIVSQGRISSVTPTQTAPRPEGVTVIDAHGRWIVPGFVDAHVHFFQSGNLYTRPDIADLTRWMPFAREVERNKARLPATFKVWIASGVTGVIDVGGPFWNFEVRAAAERTAAAPRVLVAGPLISTVARPQLDLGDPPIIKVDSPEAAREWVRRELERKPDFVKLWFIHSPGDDLASQEAIAKAVGDLAHAGGVRFAVHATGLSIAKAALRAGADYLVHSVEDRPVDEEFLGLARRRQVLYCPTLFVHLGYAYALSNTWKPTDAERRLADPQVLQSMHDLDIIPRSEIPSAVLWRMGHPLPPEPSAAALHNLLTVWRSGITVVMGTDAGNIGTLPGAAVFREMELMERAGLTPLQVLRSATINGAIAMGKESELGSIAPGKLADLVILDADPLATTANLSKIYRVIKNGQIFDPDELVRSIR